MSVLGSPFDLSTSRANDTNEFTSDDFFEVDSPEFEMELAMKVGGLEDINEEDIDAAGLYSPSSLIGGPVSPDTAEQEERMWAEVAKGLSASLEKKDIETAPRPVSSDSDISPLPYAI